MANRKHGSFTCIKTSYL